MTTQSQTELAKAIQTTESIASAGKMNPKQANTFLDYVFDLSMLKGNVRQERFRNERMEIDEVTLGQRVAMSHAEASDPQKRRGVGHRKIELRPAEITVPIEISERYLAHNLQGASMEDRIIRMMAKQFASDQEELYLNGNQLGAAVEASEIYPGMSAGFIADDYLALQDGWSHLAEGGTIVDAEGAAISPSIFSRALQELPEKYQRDMDAMRFLLPRKLDHKYVEKISQRLTNGGDSALAGGVAQSFGVTRTPVPLWNMQPTIVEHVALTGTDAIELSNAPFVDIVAVTPSTLGGVPTPAYIPTTDYTFDAAAGTVTRVALGAITDGQTVKVTYRANPQMLFTNLSNLLLGVGLDIQILEGQEIYKNVKQYVMHLRAGVQIQNVEAVVKVKNIGQD